VGKIFKMKTIDIEQDLVILLDEENIHFEKENLFIKTELEDLSAFINFLAEVALDLGDAEIEKEIKNSLVHTLLNGLFNAEAYNAEDCPEEYLEAIAALGEVDIKGVDIDRDEKPVLFVIKGKNVNKITGALIEKENQGVLH